MDKRMIDVFKAVDKINPEGDFLNKNSLSTVTDWIDTGSYALNAIISGSLYGGIPVGRITGLVGPTGCGKTIMVNNIIANFQKAVPDGIAAVWDSEVAEDEAVARSVGADPKRIKHYPVNTVEAVRNQVLRLLDGVIENNLQGKVFIAIDSLGNLASEKEVADAEKDKDAADMGLRAKAIKSMLRVLTYKAAKSKTAIVFTNHVYDDPGAMFPSLIKNQSGGKGPQYLASLLIQFSIRQDKQDESNEKDNIIAIANKVSGVTLSAMTVKNRFLPPFLKVELYLNFKNGLDKRTGLINMASAYNIIEPSGPVWVLRPEGESIGYRKDWEHNSELWDKKILPRLEETIKSQFAYSSVANTLTQEMEDDATENPTIPNK